MTGDGEGVLVGVSVGVTVGVGVLVGVSVGVTVFVGVTVTVGVGVGVGGLSLWFGFCRSSLCITLRFPIFLLPAPNQHHSHNQ